MVVSQTPPDLPNTVISVTSYVCGGLIASGMATWKGAMNSMSFASLVDSLATATRTLSQKAGLQAVHFDGKIF